MQPAFRLLVVEDNKDNRNLLVKLLRTVGFEVQEAANGREAVAIWEKWQPHLIWMDMRMPVMDGYQATRQIKASPGGKDTVIIALTAGAFEEERTRVLDHGANDFVRKPFRENEIFEMLEKHLGSRFVHEEADREGKDQQLKIGDERITEAIAMLPSELRVDLHNVAEAIDFDAAMQIIERIREQNESLANVLIDLLHSYRFDTLQKLTLSAHTSNILIVDDTPENRIMTKKLE